jgi:hypothetical protein
VKLNCAVFDAQFVRDFGANRCEMILAMYLKAVRTKNTRLTLMAISSKALSRTSDWPRWSQTAGSPKRVLGSPPCEVRHLLGNNTGAAQSVSMVAF